jgi:hypothetical protein
VPPSEMAAIMRKYISTKLIKNNKSGIQSSIFTYTKDSNEPIDR